MRHYIEYVTYINMRSYVSLVSTSKNVGTDKFEIKVDVLKEALRFTDFFLIIDV